MTSLVLLLALFLGQTPGVQSVQGVQHTPVSNSWLQNAYNEDNDRWFENNLPKATVYFADIDAAGLEWRDDEGVQIRIDRESNPTVEEVRMTLYHEECHVKTAGGFEFEHGPKFQGCMLKLAELGAFRDLW